MIWDLIKKLWPKPHFEVRAFGRTDTGRKRRLNEDAFSILAQQRVYMVADGMGGHNAGDVASRQAIEYMAQLMTSGTLRNMRGNTQEIRHFLVSNFEALNQHIMKMAEENDSCKGMGTTFITACIDGDKLVCCHVGDVRCYRIGNAIHQITNDHTYAAEFERENQNDPQAMTNAPPKNIISRAIGFPFPDPPEFHSVKISRGDRFILCSDGLWNMVPDPAISQIVGAAATPDEACEILIDKANEAGGKDNITVVTIFID